MTTAPVQNKPKAKASNNSLLQSNKGSAPFISPSRNVESGKDLANTESGQVSSSFIKPTNSNKPTKDNTSETVEPKIPERPTESIDITEGLNLSNDWYEYLSYVDKKKQLVPVKIGADYSGEIQITRKKSKTEGVNDTFELTSNKTNNSLNVLGLDFLNPLKEVGVTPVLVLNKFGESNTTTGYLNFKIGEKYDPKPESFIATFNKHMKLLGLLGLKTFKINNLENKFENGKMIFELTSFETQIENYVEASGNMAIRGSNFSFDLLASIEVPGIESGELKLTRTDDGKLVGSAEIAANIANIGATIFVKYDDGAITMKGTGKMESEKFSGEITLLVTDKASSKQMMHDELGINSIENNTSQESEKKTPNNQVLSAWGTVHAKLTPWLEGTATVGIDHEGHVTMIGEVVMPDEMVLMEQRGKRTDLFKVEIKAGYGIPLVGQVFLFASIGMFVNAGFGPLVLRDIGFTGTYSTDPKVLQNFSITGKLGISAFALIGLEAEAGVGLTLLGHDLKAGINVTAAAGLRAYAEAQPTFEYIEKASPEGGKVGESRLKGHFEAAAELFLLLSGALFFEIDSPWWSPAPDGREETPMGSIEYPLGKSIGIGANIDYLVGSDEVPEIALTDTAFKSEKFLSDMTSEPEPKKLGNTDADSDGKWIQDGQSAKAEESKVDENAEGSKEKTKKKKDYTSLPDRDKFYMALDDISKLENNVSKPRLKEVKKTIKNIKKKYDLDKITIVKKTDNQVEIFVKQKTFDNKGDYLKIKIKTKKEIAAETKAAKAELRKREKQLAKEGAVYDEAMVMSMIKAWNKASEIIVSAKVTILGNEVNYTIYNGVSKENVPGESLKPKMPEVVVEEENDKNESTKKVVSEVTEETGAETKLDKGSKDKATQQSKTFKGSFPNITSKYIGYNIYTGSKAKKTSLVKSLNKPLIEKLLKEGFQSVFDSKVGVIIRRNPKSELNPVHVDAYGFIKKGAKTKGIKHIPKTKIIYKKDPNHALANPLTSIPDDGGSKPKQLPGWDHAVAINEGRFKKVYVRGHMASEHFGGTGDKENISILTYTNNSGMSNGPERFAKDETEKGKILKYQTTWINHPKAGKRTNFAQEVTVSISIYSDFKKGILGSTKVQKFTQAAPPLTPIGAIVNLNDLGFADYKKIFNIETKWFAEDLYNTRKKIGVIPGIFSVIPYIMKYYESIKFKSKYHDRKIKITENSPEVVKIMEDYKKLEKFSLDPINKHLIINR